MRNEEDPQPLLWWGRCAVREIHKYIAWPCTAITHSHTPKHSYTTIRMCHKMHTDKCQLMHINKACQPTKQQNSKEKKSFSFLFFHQCALPRKSRHEAFTQQQQPYLLLNNTIFSLCDWAVLHTLWALRRLYSLSVTVTAQIIPAQWGMFQGPSTECHSNHFKLQDFLQPIKKRVHNS